MSLLNKFPSWDNLLKGASESFVRFPFAVVNAILGAAVAVHLIQIESVADHIVHQKLLMAMGLGLPLFIALVAFAEKRQWSRGGSIVLQVLGVVLLGLYYLLLPEDIEHPYLHLVRFVLLAIGLHFLVAVLPFVRGGQVQGFWQYNKSLLLRILTAVVYSGVLYVGLAIALAAADHLFGIDVDEKRYFQLWVIIASVFNTWVFLAGFPKDLETLETTDDYPIGLKVFTQYILLPLVGLYFVILFAYELKIIFTWNWPKGWVSQLVLWYSVVGILSLLLLHPLRNISGSRWIEVFSRWFFRALIPLVAMLFLAIFQRISDYGITENRYFVLAMAIGLAIVVLYFVFSRARDIRIIPIVLCAIAFLSAFGPWSAFSVSRSSQVDRLDAMLVEYELFADGELLEPPSGIPSEVRQEMSSIVRYLSEFHGLEPFSAWLGDSALVSLDSVPEYRKPEEIADLMGFDYVNRWGGGEMGEYFYLSVGPHVAGDISDYDYVIDMTEMPYDSIGIDYTIDSVTVKVMFDREEALLTVELDEARDGESTAAELDLYASIIELTGDSDRSGKALDQMTFGFSCQVFEGIFIASSINGNIRDDGMEVTSMSGLLFIRVYR